MKDENKKPMTTHELAKLLLEKEDAPIYLEENYEHMGEYSTGFSNITGISSDRLEHGFVFEYDYLSADPNSHKYTKGDAIVFVEEPTEKIPAEISIKLDDMLYMLIEKRAMYHSWHVDRIGFYEDDDVSSQQMLKPKIRVSKKSGFKTEWQDMTLDEAIHWYNIEFEKEIKEWC